MSEREINLAIADCRAKLHPTQIRVSGLFAAMLCYMVGMNKRPWTTPGIGSMSVTSDGFLIGYPTTEDGRLCHSTLFGEVEDLVRNVEGVIDAADLSEDAGDLLLSLIPEGWGTINTLHWQRAA